jgi:hypothetical protein
MLALATSIGLAESPANLPASRPLSAMSDSDKARFAAFMMRDFDFITTAAPMPDEPASDIKRWIQATRSRVYTLRRYIADQGLHQRVLLSADTVDHYLDRYYDLLSLLSVVDFVVEVRQADGDGSWKSEAAYALEKAGDFVSNNATDMLKVVANPKAILIQATLATGCLATSRGLAHLDKEEVRRSLMGKVNALKAAQVDRLVNEFFEERNTAIAELKENASAFAVSPPGGPANDIGAHPSSAPESADNFQLVLAAYAKYSEEPVAAADLLVRAANAVPDFGAETRQFLNRHYRGPYLLMASHLLSFAGRGKDSESALLNGRAIAIYELALPFFDGQRASIPYPYSLAYTRSLVRTGSTQSVRQIQMLAGDATAQVEDQRLQASRLYDCACLYGQLGGEYDALALEMLAMSYRAKPRRDPYALRDPELISLVLRRKAEVINLADHPLIGGQWENPNDSNIYMFYPDGSLWQRRSGERLAGKWNVVGDQLHLTGRPGLADSSCTFQVSSDLGQLQLQHQGIVFDFERDTRSLTAGYPLHDRRLAEDGSWVWSNGTAAFASRLSTIRTPDQQKREFWFCQEHPLRGRLDQIVVEN